MRDTLLNGSAFESILFDGSVGQIQGIQKSEYLAVSTWIACRAPEIIYND
jgi:hypothetical protein